MEIYYIPAIRRKITRAVIYARVSTSGKKQLESLAAQVSAMTQDVYVTENWVLCDIYMEVVSGKAGSPRRELSRLIDDCKKGLIDYVLVKSVERFGRDTTEVLAAVREIKKYGANVFFFREGIDTGKMSSELGLSLTAALAQAENESRSANIRLGLVYGAENGTSSLYRRKCYGYDKDENGELVINESQAAVVRLIYRLCIEGSSINKIREYLWEKQIATPTGEMKMWSRKSISDILSNKKYIGIAVIKPCRTPGGYSACPNVFPIIVESSIYEQAQTQIEKRTKRKPARKEHTGNDYSDPFQIQDEQ